MMRLMIGRYKGVPARPKFDPSSRAWGRSSRHSHQSTTKMLNASGSRRIMQENLVKATGRGRRWYATTVKNVLDRAGDQQVREAA